LLYFSPGILLKFIFSHINLQLQNCNAWSNDHGVINVHLVPHTHDDLGWIKTVDQYYYGAKPELVPVGVQYIFNTVIDELQKSPERRFSFAETGFLWRWYNGHGDFEKHKLQKLVKTGQIEMIGGGWVQNDEAACHYVDIVDQMTLGLKKLDLLFGECGKPQVAWQIDPFGHSKEQANLFAMVKNFNLLSESKFRGCSIPPPRILLISIFSHINLQFQNCNAWSNDHGVINVHLVPHTHDDLGWIKTVDQYYYGAKPELVPVGVQYIFNTVIDELQKSPERRFSFAETGFLWRWYNGHGDFEKHKLQKLVKTGQVEMIGGGWVQNDEAACHYVDIVDQMTLGLKKLDLLFGECGKPQVAWQIDPFGHSKEQANLFAMMGFNSLFFARIHYLEKEARLKNKSLEFIWNASDDLKTQILTGAFYQDNYGPPEGFCWDALCGDDPIMDDPDLEGYNVDQKINTFVNLVKKQASFLRSSHVMLLMGSDFQYTNANTWYTNLDKLIRYVNGNSTHGIKAFYSTPSCYVKAVTDASTHLPTKDDDFFPYASSNTSYWTGYFTSRPTLKGMIRDASSLLQLSKQLDALADLGPEDDADVETMARASALAQHHDAVTGTAKENVTRDYEKRLAIAFKEGEVGAVKLRVNLKIFIIN
ncbi:glycosyl hydrolase family 38 protein, partial [Oesophagostomum dentatum]